ncbi:MAG TPA: DUF1638 domain-containing protein [Candidatus Sulfotelmatobacter sp.]|nr:DUF1638 domain-containing protein [Candidatus Sulfotelmatobacter sp.]
MKFRLISCEIFYREFSTVVARSPHLVDIEFLPKGLHDIGAAGMRERIQAAVDRVDPSGYDAILIGYGLCNNGIVGMASRQKPLVVPRAHDCITLFLGNKERYLDYFQNNPGVYFQTTGWIERGSANGELSQLTVGKKLKINQSFEELVARYGEDNARYLWEQLGSPEKNYRKMTFIEMGIEPDASFERIAQQKANARHWEYEKVQGDMGMFERLVNGIWNDDEFLVVPPGSTIVATYDDGVIAVEGVQRDIIPGR